MRASKYRMAARREATRSALLSGPCHRKADHSTEPARRARMVARAVRKKAKTKVEKQADLSGVAGVVLLVAAVEKASAIHSSEICWVTAAVWCATSFLCQKKQLKLCLS